MIDDTDIAAAIRATLSLARWEARRRPPMREEFESAAMLGVAEAVGLYDAGRGASLATFAAMRARSAMRDAVQREAPRGCGRKVRGGTPGQARPAVYSLSRAPQRDAARMDGDSEHAATFEVADRRPEPAPAWQSEEAFRSALRGLPEQHRRIVTLVYLDDLSQAEAGERLGVGHSRASYILKDALAFLRSEPRALARLRGDGPAEVPALEAVA